MPCSCKYRAPFGASGMPDGLGGNLSRGDEYLCSGSWRYPDRYLVHQRSMLLAQRAVRRSIFPAFQRAYRDGWLPAQLFALERIVTFHQIHTPAVGNGRIRSVDFAVGDLRLDAGEDESEAQ